VAPAGQGTRPLVFRTKAGAPGEQTDRGGRPGDQERPRTGKAEAVGAAAAARPVRSRAVAGGGSCYRAGVSLGLSAPAAVPVELRAADRRSVRLSEEIGTGGIRLTSAAPFEPGRPVEVRFALPGSTVTLVMDGEVVTTGDPSEDAGERGGAAIYFLKPTPDERTALASYVSERLGIPLLL
jgi:hypothetical protein